MNGAIAHLAESAPLLALLAGGAYASAWAAAAHAVWGGRRSLWQRSDAAAVRLRRWRGWGPLRAACGVAWALGFGFVMTVGGILAAADLGLGAVDWGSVLPWVVTISLGGAAWLGLFWGVHWRWLAQQQPRACLHRPPSWARLLLSAVEHETGHAIYRAALMPLAGPYWGVWLGAAAKMLSAHASPFLADRLAVSGRREWAYLEWALDLLAALAFLLSRSAWAAVMARLAAHAALTLVWRLAAGRAAAALSESSAPTPPG